VGQFCYRYCRAFLNEMPEGLCGMKRQHQAFLQGIMCKKMLPADEVKKLFLKCHKQANVEMPDFLKTISSFITLINRSITPFGMKIHKGIEELYGKPFYVLVSEQETEITRMADNYSGVEIELFRKLVDLVVMSETGNTSSKNVLNLTSTLEKHMTKSDAEKLLERFEEDMLITQVRGKVSLSTLSILELNRYFEVMYPESIVKCAMCKQMVLQGVNCPNCELKIHNHCAKRYWTSEKKCPQCRVDWPIDEEEPRTPSSTSSSDQSAASSDQSAASSDRRASRKRKSTE